MISVVVIYNESDEKYLQHLAESITFDHELILAKTIPALFWKSEIKRIDGHIRYIDLQYAEDDFSFSKLRNHAKNTAKYDWILNIDADERLCADTSEIEFIVNNKSFGGAYVNVINYTQGKNEFKIFSGKRLSIFRKEFDFRYRVHELVEDDIRASNLKIIDTTITVKHVGYLNTTINKIKTDRNLYLLCQDIVEGGLNSDREKRLYDTLQYKKDYSNGKFE